MDDPARGCGLRCGALSSKGLIRSGAQVLGHPHSGSPQHSQRLHWDVPGIGAEPQLPHSRGEWARTCMLRSVTTPCCSRSASCASHTAPKPTTIHA